MAFSQSEKVKAGLIWVSQALELLKATEGQERQGGEKTVKAILDMIVHDIRLAANLTGESLWKDIETQIGQALVMIQSGVGPEAVTYLTQALSQVTTIGHRSMSLLKEKDLL